MYVYTGFGDDSMLSADVPSACLRCNCGPAVTAQSLHAVSVRFKIRRDKKTMHACIFRQILFVLSQEESNISLGGAAVCKSLTEIFFR